MNDLGDRIKQAIKLSGKRQCQIADEIGITETSLSRYASGDRIPKISIVFEIAKACGASVEWLVTGKEPLRKHIEMITDYIVMDEDYQYNDNHGVLTRCRDCKNYGTRACVYDPCFMPEPDDYCSHAVRKDDGNS